MTKIRGLLFDKDGTLFDFKQTWGEWARRFFLDLAKGDPGRAAEFAHPLGYDFASGQFSKSSVIIAGTPDEVASALVAVFPDFSTAEMFDKVNAIAAKVPQIETVPLFPLLQAFKADGLAIGVATNDAEAPALAHLSSVNILELFDFVAGFDSGFGAKPAPGMQHGFCKATGLEPAEVAMVGDSTHDLMSGRAAGMTTIAVLTGMAEAEELAPFADVVLPDIGAIPDWLDR